MKHDFWDKYSRLSSPVHRLSPGIKLFATLVPILLLSILNPETLIYLIPVLVLWILLVIFIASVPISFILKRAAVIFPFVLPIIVLNAIFSKAASLELITLYAVRSLLSILLILLLISTTRFTCLLKCLKKLRFPRTILLTLSFMYRYFFLLSDELEKMVRAVSLRSGNGSRLNRLKTYSHIVGILFIKSYDRSKRVYQSMVMRGFEETWREL